MPHSSRVGLAQIPLWGLQSRPALQPAAPKTLQSLTCYNHVQPFSRVGWRAQLLFNLESVAMASWPDAEGWKFAFKETLQSRSTPERYVSGSGPHQTVFVWASWAATAKRCVGDLIRARTIRNGPQVLARKRRDLDQADILLSQFTLTFLIMANLSISVSRELDWDRIKKHRT